MGILSAQGGLVTFALFVFLGIDTDLAIAKILISITRSTDHPISELTLPPADVTVEVN